MAQPQANQPTRGSSSTVGRPAIAVSTTMSLLVLYWLRRSCRCHKQPYIFIMWGLVSLSVF